MQLQLLPTRAGYSVQQPSEFVAYEVAGALPKIRRTVDGGTKVLTFDWKVKRAQYSYIMALYRMWLRLPEPIGVSGLRIDGGNAVSAEFVFKTPPEIKGYSGALLNVSCEVYSREVEARQQVDDEASLWLWKYPSGAVLIGDTTETIGVLMINGMALTLRKS